MLDDEVSGKVYVTSFSADDAVIEHAIFNYDDYYGSGIPLIDSAQFRAYKGIRRATGRIFDSSGALQQSFENFYDERGVYVRSRIAFSDGTIVED